jgi:hypothetical protein
MSVVVTIKMIHLIIAGANVSFHCNRKSVKSHSQMKDLNKSFHSISCFCYVSSLQNLGTSLLITS